MASKKAKRIRRQNGQWVHSKASVSLAPVPWDHGASGQANRIGLIVEERGELDARTGKVVNPNRVTGARRVDMLEIYHKRGWITTRGYGAGELLRVAWLRTDMGTCAPWLRERVDSSPKPDEAVAVQIDRLSSLIRIARLIPAGDKAILDRVCRQGAGVGSLPQYRNVAHTAGIRHLSDALERLADRAEGR